MNHHPIQYQSKSEMAYDTLKRMIVEGEIEAGRNYSVSDIVLLLGVSRTPIARAINTLAEQGIVTLVPKVGFTVNSLEWKDLEEHAYIQTHLSKLVSRWVIERAPDEAIEALTPLSMQVRAAVVEENKEAYLKLSRDFFLAICKMVDANRCAYFVEKNWEFEGWYVHNLKENKDKLLRLCDNHDRIIEALKKRDLALMDIVYDEHTQCCLDILRCNIHGKNSENV